MLLRLGMILLRSAREAVDFDYNTDKQPKGTISVKRYKLTGSTVSGAPSATAAGYDTVTVRLRGSGLG